MAVCLDLFGTIIEFDAEQLPETVVGAERWRSTIGVTHAALVEEYPEVTLEKYAEVWGNTSEWLRETRSVDGREIHAVDRFLRILDGCLGSTHESRRKTAERMTQVHMTWLSHATVIPPKNLSVMHKLRGTYRLGLISNFDHGPTGWSILRHHHLDTLFDVVVLSDEIGFRKPHPSLFHHALSILKVSAGDTLFVGDTPEADICGPKELGMDVAWIDKTNLVLAPGIPTPEYRIGSLSDLEGILGFGG
jgi:FMN phosphatase YigB (HAD superfamily)